ncbi:unnamed protein product [Haemonchus placei]|uniref:Ig-like domain-containing protein n=1 Tax=Haemonchus placei TaxID=6290 RepID=A0A158QP66_HAEPC|nr:unnamed protein product [Haemonchus placei]
MGYHHPSNAPTMNDDGPHRRFNALLLDSDEELERSAADYDSVLAVSVDAEESDDDVPEGRAFDEDRKNEEESFSILIREGISLKTDVRVVKFGTTLKLNCSDYKPEGSSYWERQHDVDDVDIDIGFEPYSSMLGKQRYPLRESRKVESVRGDHEDPLRSSDDDSEDGLEDGKDEMKLAAQNAESLTVTASHGQLYYTCYVEDVDYYKQTTSIYIFAVEGPPPAPQFTFRLVRSKPYKLHVDWMVDWREDIPTRRLNVTVKQDDDPKVKAEEIMEKKGTVSTDISADIASITVLANASYGENFLQTVEKTINIEHITLVNFGISDDDTDTIKIRWNVLGGLPNEEPQYKIKFECGKDYKEEKMVKQNSIVVAIKRRPYKCDLFAQAILDSYEGPVAKYRVKLKAKSPEVAPTNVKFTNEGLTTTITFVPIPKEVMRKYGENQGCQVFVCKEKKASRKCFNKTASPQAGEVKFENLEEYGIALLVLYNMLIEVTACLKTLFFFLLETSLRFDRLACESVSVTRKSISYPSPISESRFS